MINEAFIFFMLILFISAVSTTNIIVNASILDFIRIFIHKRSGFLSSLIGCMLCTGFWVGLFFGIIPYFSMPAGFIIYDLFWYAFPLLFALIVSISSSFYDILTDYYINK
jgi:hypothetical protein